MVKSTWGGDLRTFGSGSGTRSRGEQSHEDKIRLESSKPGPGKSDLYQATGLGPARTHRKGVPRKSGLHPRPSESRRFGTWGRLVDSEPERGINDASDRVKDRLLLSNRPPCTSGGRDGGSLTRLGRMTLGLRSRRLVTT
jgi:hypothetical protein